MTGAVHGVLASAVPPAYVVTLSGETITGTDNGGGPTWSASAALIVRADGTIDKVETGVGTTQIDSATDWIIPNGEASSDYEVMIHEDSGTLNRSFQDAIDTWLSLGGDRDWGVQYSSSVAGLKPAQQPSLSVRMAAQ